MPVTTVTTVVELNRDITDTSNIHFVTTFDLLCLQN